MHGVRVRCCTLDRDDLQCGESGNSRVSHSTRRLILAPPHQATSDQCDGAAAWRWSLDAQAAKHHEVHREAPAVPKPGKHDSHERRRQDATRGAPLLLASISTSAGRHGGDVQKRLSQWVRDVQQRLGAAGPTQRPEHQRQVDRASTESGSVSQGTAQPCVQAAAPDRLRGGGGGGTSHSPDNRGQQGNELVITAEPASNSAATRYVLCIEILSLQ